MASWYTGSSAINEWKAFIAAFEQNKLRQAISQQHIQYSLEPHLLPSLKNIELFLSNVSLILNEAKSYNNQMTDFLRANFPLMLKETIRMVLQVPESYESTQRKNKYPLQSLQFIEQFFALPNIFNINILKEELFLFYCKAFMHYFRLNLAKIQQKKNHKEYQNNIYSNYFLRLFKQPESVVDFERQIGFGTNYTSITINAGTPFTTTPKKLNFLECLISVIEKTPNCLDLMIANISNESLLQCLSSMVLKNGMYNYPYPIKQQIIRKLLSIKKKYTEFLSNFMNSKFSEKQFISTKQQIQLQLENILQFQFLIVSRSANIYDGIKFFELIVTLDNIKDIIYISSVNFVWTKKSMINQPLVPLFIEEHTTELLFAIIHKDTVLYKSSNASLELQPKTSMKDVNADVQPLLLSLKELISEKAVKASIKHLNLIKMLGVMILNRQKYEIIDTIIIKHNILCVLVEICNKFNQMDIMVSAVIDIFKGIFKGDINLFILHVNTPNLQEFKNKNDLIEQKLIAETFKAAEIILAIIKNMKSHKDPLFGHFFQLAKTIKQFTKNYFSTMQSSNSLEIGAVSGGQHPNLNSTNFLLQPVYRNTFIKLKCKEWQDFYLANFYQLQSNYLRELGKFSEFENVQQQNQVQFTVLNCAQQKDLTNSQMLQDQAEIQATIKNSIQILSLKKQQPTEQSVITNNTSILNFKKVKAPTSKNQNGNFISESLSKTSTSQILTKDEIEITNQPIKIQFKRKNIEIEQTSQPNSTCEYVSVEQGQNSFKDFMKKKLIQITEKNRQNIRKKSATPSSKFKSADSKTPPKVKKWNASMPQELSNLPKEKSLNENSQLSTNFEKVGQTKKQSVDQKLQKIKKRIQYKKLEPVRLIRVNKLPKIYKERDLSPNGKDARIMAWLRG